MNILPKKRWHVRTKENIARVRKDEAEAAEKERQENLRIQTANREARLNILKLKSKEKLSALGVDTLTAEKSSTTDTSEFSSHINFFTDIDHAVSITNKEHDKELKEKQEEYEKKICYLTYLGQDTNESLKKKNWYEIAPKTRCTESKNIRDTYEKLILKDADGKPKEKDIDVHNGEYYWKSKQQHDPINNFRKYCENKTIPKIKSSDKNVKEVRSQIQDKISKKKLKETKEDKSKKLEKLREARLRREQEEKSRTNMFLSGLNKSTKTTCETIVNPGPSKIKPKYNSQFNPELARQNFR